MDYKFNKKKENMKRFTLFMMFCMLMAVLPVRADLGASVMLRHNGQTTFYQWDEVQKAVNAAVDGDTIYLTEGTYAPFNITKRIMVRGAGPETMINGDCLINIPNDQKLVMPVLDALTFSGTVQVNSAGRQLTFRKTRMKILNFKQTEVSDVKLDRCCITAVFRLPTNVRSLNCFNTKIWELRPVDHKNGNLKFSHCNIIYITDTIAARFERCVLRSVYSVGQRPNNYYDHHNCLIGCVLVNCIYSGIYRGSGNAVNHVYYEDSPFDKDCRIITESELRYDEDVFNFRSSNYLSTLDGTMIGCYGGQYPYNLYPDLPTVTQHRVKVDAANRKLNVTLTLDKK